MTSEVSSQIYFAMSSSPPSKEYARSQTSESDNASILSASSTKSTTQLLKSKILPSKKTKDAKTPGEKQAQRRNGRMSDVTIGTLMSLK